MTNGKLENRVALITGGTTGIGLATAKRFAAESARVVVTGRNAETLAAACGHLDGQVEVVESDALVTGASSGIGEATAERLAKAGYKVYGTSRRGAQAGKRWFEMLRFVLPLIASAIATPALAADPVAEVRVYALDCGRADFKDMGMLSDTGEYDGKPGSLVDPCFVIRHPKGTLLWDTGLGDEIADSPTGLTLGGIQGWVDHKLADQLKTLGLTPADITFVAFSHFHFDHTGNANAFPSSTWILDKAEVAWATATPPPPAVMPDTFSGYKTAKTQMIDGDLDVFGDGSVRILHTPGHTPGHHVLMVTLRKAGTVLLSGDLYPIRDSRKAGRVPMGNVSRADTLASINRVEKIAGNRKARVVVQHDPADFKSLPKFPAYLQ
jgi:N-acyl homoserine lactone hydrolase